MNIILIGFKNCGKSTVGKLLAEKLAYSFIDTDDLIIQRYHDKAKTVREIYQELGKQQFRELECLVIENLSLDGNTVIAVGGGTVLEPRNVTALQTLGTLVFLQQAKHVIKERIEAQGLPPFLRDAGAHFDEVFAERNTAYHDIADVVVDVYERNSEMVIAEITEKVYLIKE